MTAMLEKNASDQPPREEAKVSEEAKNLEALLKINRYNPGGCTDLEIIQSAITRALASSQAEFKNLAEISATEIAEAHAERYEANRRCERLLNVARGCHDYNGGHRGPDAEVFHHGVQTVINSLEAAAKNDPNDTQVNALERIGHAALAPDASGKEGAP